MLLGQYARSLDEKGRFALPVEFRDDLVGPLYFALGDEGGASIWPAEHFNAKLEEKKAFERMGGPDGLKAFRRFTGFASPVKMDNLFRISVPESLRERVGLERSRPITIMGNFDRVEVWDAAQLAQYLG